MGTDRLHLNPVVQLLSAVIGRSQYLKSAADIGHGMDLIEDLQSDSQLSNDLHGSVALAFHGLLLANSGQLGGPHKDWFSFLGTTYGLHDTLNKEKCLS